MSNSENEKIDYGNWMPRKAIYIGFVTNIIQILLIRYIVITWIRIVLGIFLVIFMDLFILSICAYRTFSLKGKDLQNKVYDQVLNHLQWDGSGICLDIGCGNAPLSIKIAKKYPRSKVIASDYWGETMFEFDQNQSKINAKLEGVSNQIEFKHANAAKLPFEDNTLDAVISNLVFHEVKDFKMKEKHKAFLEALRVLKPGSVFAIQDLFGCKSIFGDFAKLKNIIEENVSELHWIDSFSDLNLPKWLNNPIMLGGMGIFYGKK